MIESDNSPAKSEFTFSGVKHMIVCSLGIIRARNYTHDASDCDRNFKPERWLGESGSNGIDSIEAEKGRILGENKRKATSPHKSP